MSFCLCRWLLQRSLRPSGPRLVGCWRRILAGLVCRCGRIELAPWCWLGKAQGQQRGQLPRIGQRVTHGEGLFWVAKRGIGGEHFRGLSRGKEPRRILFWGVETHLRGRRWRLPRTTAWCCSTCLARAAMPARLRRGSALGPAQAPRASARQ